MKPALESHPWFVPSFLIVWIACMIYVGAYLGMVVRYRSLTGQSSGEADFFVVFFDPDTRQYFRWMFTGRHRELANPAFSRHVYIVRTLFAVAAILMLIFCVAIFKPH